MPRKYKRLTYEDRKTIEEMCRNGKKADEIARLWTYIERRFTTSCKGAVLVVEIGSSTVQIWRREQFRK